MALIPSTQTGSLSGKQKGTHDIWFGSDNGDEVVVHSGDAFDMHDGSRGGNDLLIAGKNNPSNLLNGDAFDMYDHARGGHDILIGGDGAFFDQLDGDAVSMYGHAVGGNDMIVAGNAGFSVMHGDAVFMYLSSEARRAKEEARRRKHRLDGRKGEHHDVSRSYSLP